MGTFGPKRQRLEGVHMVSCGRSQEEGKADDGRVVVASDENKSSREQGHIRYGHTWT